MTTGDKPLILWRISDGKSGHDVQSQGLIAALCRLRDCKVFQFQAPPLTEILAGLFTRKFKAANDLPDPDLIIGAGHGTHTPILCARLARGGTSIVLMKPTLPTSWFDFCLIPGHDNPENNPNIISTIGALTTIRPSLSNDQDRGLFLIGGPSKHFSWDQTALINQIKTIILKTQIQWQMTDSPRTPMSASKAFSDLDMDNLNYRPYSQSSREWLEEQLSLSSKVWVTQDSITMISEALSSGAAVGLLSMPVNKQGRITRALDEFRKSGLVTPYTTWEAGSPLSPPARRINESERCAEILLERSNRAG